MQSGPVKRQRRTVALSVDVLCGIRWGDPELFHVSDISSEESDGGKKTTYTFTYNAYAADYKGNLTMYRVLLSDSAKRIRGRMTEGAGEREVLRLIHDEIVNRYSYDESLTVRDAYTMMKTGSGVCSAYTQLFIALCHEFGFECHYLLSRSMDHAWNLVKVDGKFLHVDCTWDDPIGGSPTDTYFLLTDEEMKANGHQGWVDVTALAEPNGNTIVLLFLASLGLFALSVLYLIVRIVSARNKGKNGTTRCFGKCSDEELLRAMSRAYALTGGGSPGDPPDGGVPDNRDGT